MNTSSVVVTYNSAASLQNCLDSLRLNNIQEIIVVDNGSIDNSVKIAQAAGVRVIQNSENKGFGAAANQGAALCTNPYILFLNPDAVLDKKVIEDVETSFKNNLIAGAIGLHLVDNKGISERDNYGSEVTPWLLLTRHFISGLKVTKASSVAWVSGGAMCVRRVSFQAVHGFDTHYFLYWEDVDLCRRIRHELQQQIIFLPTARVIHQRGASLKDNRYKTKLYDASADRYVQKHYSALICHLLRFVRRLYRFWQPQVR